MKDQLKKLLLSFTSRKFLVAVVTACLLFFDKKLGLGLSLEEKGLAAGIGAFWIFAESAIDFKAVKGGLELEKLISTFERVLPIISVVMEKLSKGGSVDLGLEGLRAAVSSGAVDSAIDEALKQTAEPTSGSPSEEAPKA